MKPFLTNAFVLVAKWLVVSEGGDIPLLSHRTGIAGCDSGSPGFSPSETFFLHKDQKLIALPA